MLQQHKQATSTISLVQELFARSIQVKDISVRSKINYEKNIV